MRPLITFLLLGLPLIGIAQSQRPEWCDANTRRILYPESEYFVGFQSGFAQQGETLEKAVSRIKTDAQGDAAQRIQVQIKSSTLDAVTSVQRQTAENFDEEIRRNFAQQTYSTASVEIPNLQNATWSDPSTREVAVLVYTKKRDFVRFYDRQIESLLGKMEVGLENALQHEQQGSQIKGRTTAEEALKFCPQVEYAQRMVALADVNASMDDLQMPRYTTVVRNLIAAINRMRHATAFYIKCSAKIDNQPYNLFDREIRGLLSEKGCHFTDNPNDADWLIDIDASVIGIDHKEGMAYFARIDGTLSIRNGKTGKKLLEDRLSTLQRGNYDGIKGGDFKPEKATRIAYHNAARIIAESILKIVQE